MFVEPAEACGYTVDIFFTTYDHEASTMSGNATAALAKQYGHRVKDSLVISPSVKVAHGHYIKGNWNQRTMFNAGLERISDYHQKHEVSYDAILVLRHDVVLQQRLLELPGVRWRLVLFPWQERSHKNLEDPVGDAIQWYPWRYANCLRRCGFRGHNSTACLWPRVGRRNIGFMLDGRHVTDTSLEPNPLYRMIRKTPGKTAVIVLDLGVANGSQAAPEADLWSAAGAAFEEHVVDANDRAGRSSTDHFRGAEVLAYGLDAACEPRLRAHFGNVTAFASGSVDGRSNPTLHCRNDHLVGAETQQFLAWAYAVTQAVALLRRRELELYATYERVVFARSDVLIQSDVVVHKMDRDTVYVSSSGAGGGSGPGLAAMSRDVAVRFGDQLYSSLPRNHCRIDPEKTLHHLVWEVLEAKLEERQGLVAVGGVGPIDN